MKAWNGALLRCDAVERRGEAMFAGAAHVAGSCVKLQQRGTKLSVQLFSCQRAIPDAVGVPLQVDVSHQIEVGKARAGFRFDPGGA